MSKQGDKIHEWYLEATKELNPKSYNPNAQKSYQDLTEEQKFIDRYIAKKALAQARLQGIEECIGVITKAMPKKDGEIKDRILHSHLVNELQVKLIKST